MTFEQSLHVYFQRPPPPAPSSRRSSKTLVDPERPGGFSSFYLCNFYFSLDPLRCSTKKHDLHNMLSRPATTTALLLAAAAAHRAAASTNSFYFSFPSKTTTVPLVHNGDVLNVTWFSEYNQASLEHWCGTTQRPSSPPLLFSPPRTDIPHAVQSIPGLSGNGRMTFTVNTTWTGSCHWQLVQQGDADRYVDSGVVDVTNARASPAALTWQPAGAGTACGVATVTASAAASLLAAAGATTTAAAAAGATEGAGCVGGGGEGEGEGAEKPGLSTGASMGIGIAIGAGVAGVVTAVVWVVLRRRRGAAARGEEKAAGGAHGGDVVYQGEQQYPRVHELNPAAAYVEADGGWGSRKRITPVELPQSPGRF